MTFLQEMQSDLQLDFQHWMKQLFSDVSAAMSFRCYFSACDMENGQPRSFTFAINDTHIYKQTGILSIYGTKTV